MHRTTKLAARMLVFAAVGAAALALPIATMASTPTDKCRRFGGEGCYWMENTSGNYCWVPATWASSQQDCYALDSCDGGLGNSGGGCYKWAACSDCQRAPW